MDKKRYSKTRYQNIYKNIKNKNYIVSISTPKTTLSTIDGKKIYDINDAIKLRDDFKSKRSKYEKVTSRETFEILWDKYINECEKVEKLAYNTVKKKKRFYNAHLKKLNDKKVSKITQNEIVMFLEKENTTDKQKNELLTSLKSFFNWCCKNNYLVVSPSQYINPYKVTKNKMKYWLPEELKSFLNVVNDDILNGTDIEKLRAYTIRTFTLLDFNLGDRVGETRALTFGNINSKLKTIYIGHSINYDPNADTFFSNTKNPHSQRELDVSDKLIEEIEKWKSFLQENFKIQITDDTPIILNIRTLKPLSDTYLRKVFNYYIEKANVTKIRLYDLRHTFATTMMTEGWNMYVISNRLGHKRITTTINTYGNITEEVRKEMAFTTDKYY